MPHFGIEPKFASQFIPLVFRINHKTQMPHFGINGNQNDCLYLNATFWYRLKQCVIFCLLHHYIIAV